MRDDVLDWFLKYLEQGFDADRLRFLGSLARRFLIHVLPDGFQRIRYYGFLANRYRHAKLAHVNCWVCLLVFQNPYRETSHPTTITVPCWKD